MARAYQDAHIIDNLTSSVKTLQTQTAELTKAKGLHEERITNLVKQNTEQAKEIEALKIRSSANEHNATARNLNSHAYTSHSLQHTALTPLHDLSTDRPIRKFPKHARDITTMSQADVIQILQALDVKILGLTAGEKKAELKAQVGLPREAEEKGKGLDVKVEEKAEMKADVKADAKAPTQRTLPKIAPGSTAEKRGNVGTASTEGVSRPVAKPGAKDEKRP